MDERKALRRTFLASFFITLILSAFVMGLFWISIKAERSGFNDFDTTLSAERSGELGCRLNLLGRSIDIDLAPINSIAGSLRDFEAWLLPEDMRFVSRFACFVGDKVNTGMRQHREKEFYRNAGLV